MIGVIRFISIFIVIFLCNLGGRAVADTSDLDRFSIGYYTGLVSLVLSLIVSIAFI